MKLTIISCKFSQKCRHEVSLSQNIFLSFWVFCWWVYDSLNIQIYCNTPSVWFLLLWYGRVSLPWKKGFFGTWTHKHKIILTDEHVGWVICNQLILTLILDWVMLNISYSNSRIQSMDLLWKLLREWVVWRAQKCQYQKAIEWPLRGLKLTFEKEEKNIGAECQKIFSDFTVPWKLLHF